VTRLYVRGCPGSDDGEHTWTPVQMVMEFGNMPDPDKGRLYLVCIPCSSHTYLITEWIGYVLPDPVNDGGTP